MCSTWNLIADLFKSVPALYWSWLWRSVCESTCRTQDITPRVVSLTPNYWHLKAFTLIGNGRLHKGATYKPGMVAGAFNPSNWKAEAEETPGRSRPFAFVFFASSPHPLCFLWDMFRCVPHSSQVICLEQMPPRPATITLYVCWTCFKMIGD